MTSQRILNQLIICLDEAVITTLCHGAQLHYYHEQTPIYCKRGQKILTLIYNMSLASKHFKLDDPHRAH